MVAVDILEVPLSIQGNRYILVIQDYFTKWLEAIALKDQTADTITKELIVVFGRFGMPQFLHSDQGRNFESTLLRSTLEAFGVEKQGQQLIIHKETEWWRGQTDPSYRCFARLWRRKLIGKGGFH